MVAAGVEAVRSLGPESLVRSLVGARAVAAAVPDRDRR